MVRLVSGRDIDSGPLQVIIDDSPQYRSRVGHRHEGLAHQFAWTDGFERRERVVARQITIKVSLARTRYANSGTPRSRRRKAASIFPCERPSASRGEY